MRRLPGQVQMKKRENAVKGTMLKLCLYVLLWFLLNTVTCVSLSREEDEERKYLGEAKFREVVRKSEENACWKEAVALINSTCKKMTDVEQSRLAVAFANCHLSKSGRTTYACNISDSIKDCTGTMDSVAFQTYTEFFTHTGHICYFLQNILWQEKTENVIYRLSEASSETVHKLKRSLEHHKAIERKQNEVLGAFESMEKLAERQRDLLWEVYSSLKGSIDGIRYLMSIFLIELIGIETFIIAIVVWVMILLLPRFNYSRFWLNMLLITEQIVEIVMRRSYSKLVQDVPSASEDMSALYGWIWFCRYTSLCLGLILYLWKWFRHSNPMQQNLRMLQEIQHNIDQLNKRVCGALMDSQVNTGRGIVGCDNGVVSRRKRYGSVLGTYSKAFSRYSEPPLSPCTRWKVQNYLESLPSDIHQHTPVPTEAEDDVVALETPPNFSDDDEELQGIVWNNSTARCQCTPVPPNTPTPSKRSWSRSGETGDTATMRMAHSSKDPAHIGRPALSDTESDREKEVNEEKDAFEGHASTQGPNSNVRTDRGKRVGCSKKFLSQSLPGSYVSEPTMLGTINPNLTSTPKTHTSNRRSLQALSTYWDTNWAWPSFWTDRYNLRHPRPRYNLRPRSKTPVPH